MKNQAPRNNNPQSDNVLVIILIGIVLFAGLSFVVAQSMRANVHEVTAEKRKAFLELRKKVVDLQRAGDVAAAESLLKQGMLPASEAFLSSIRKLKPLLESSVKKWRPCLEMGIKRMFIN